MNGHSTDNSIEKDLKRLPLISVIVPVYDAEKYLKRCVDSLLQQSYPRLEIILVDDGSVDLGGKMCDDYAETQKNIHVIHKKNGGLVSAWMTGAKTARGAYFSFVDSDDWAEPCMIEALAAQITWRADDNGSRDEIVCSSYLIDHANGDAPQKVGHELMPGVYEGKELREKVFCHILGNERRTVSLSRCMKLFSGNLILQNLHYCDQKIRMGEDVTITLPAILDCKRLVILDEHYDYHYYFNPVSMVHHYDSGLYENVRQLHRIMTAVMTEKYAALGIAEPTPEDAVSREYVYLFCLVLKNELRSKVRGAAVRMYNCCRREQMGALVTKNGITSSDALNRLLLYYMKYPSVGLAALMCAGLRIADCRRQRHNR